MSSNSQLPDSASENIKALDLLSTLPELLTQHLTKRPDAVAYKVYDNARQGWKDLTFKDVYDTVHVWRHALAAHAGLEHGDRIAMLLPNCPNAIFFDQSVLANALVPVPLHAIDTPKSSAYILNDSGAKILVTNKMLKWKQIRDIAELPALELVVITDDLDCDDPTAAIPVMSLKTFLDNGKTSKLPTVGPKPTDLAALVYTSGTTGNPKGVMLTHRNIIANIQGVLKNLVPYEHETMLSFLPLSHTFERTTTYYLSLALGFTVAFNRSISHLQQDLRDIRPSVLMSVPRVYEMIYGRLRDGLAKKPKYVQRMFDWAVNVGWRRFCRENGLPVEPNRWAWLDPMVEGFLDKKVGSQLRRVFGDNIHFFISGGAALNPTISRVFLALGVDIYQGYGMTETSPIISVNRQGCNRPNTVGPALPNLEVRLGDGDELQVRGPTVMKGYWNREDATREIFMADDWLRTGDVVKIYPDGCIRITGRIKEIIVTSTGEKVPPSDLEAAIENDRLFSQSMVIGDDRPYIAALAVVNADEFERLCGTLGLDPKDDASLSHPEVKKAALRRVKAATSGFPNYGVPRQICLLRDAWTIDNGLLTPTLKMKRNVIAKRFADQIDVLYAALTKKKKK